jgi:hypothetical protein
VKEKEKLMDKKDEMIENLRSLNEESPEVKIVKEVSQEDPSDQIKLI